MEWRRCLHDSLFVMMLILMMIILKLQKTLFQCEKNQNNLINHLFFIKQWGNRWFFNDEVNPL